MVSLTVGTNSYLDFTDADTYLANYVSYSVWAGSTNPVKQPGPIRATAKIDSNVSFPGRAYSNTQSLAFPREEFSYYDGKLGYYLTVPANTYPAQLLEATAVQAAYYLEYKDDFDSGGDALEWSRIKIDLIELEDTSRNTKGASGKARRTIAPDTKRLLRWMEISTHNSWWRSW